MLSTDLKSSLNKVIIKIVSSVSFISSLSWLSNALKQSSIEVKEVILWYLSFKYTVV